MTVSNLLRIRESKLECVDAAGSLLWCLPIESIVLISEYTTNEGPYVDDYFLVFVTAEDSKFYFATCSFYSNGRDDILSSIEKRLGSPVQLGLQSSTDWRSRVVWPVNMAGSEYFTFTEVPAETLPERLKKKLLGPTYEYAISKTVRDYLREKLTGRP